jgi:hypothetical protein
LVLEQEEEEEWEEEAEEEDFKVINLLKTDWLFSQLKIF